MRKQLQRSRYLFIILLSMFSATANAQIVYTDVNPDTTISCSSAPCNKSYKIDLNNDNIVDFTLGTYFNTGQCQPRFPSYYKGVYVTSQSGNATVTLMMNTNNLIDSNLAFTSNNGTLIYSKTGRCGSSYSGNWTSSSDHYLGLKLTVGANSYYGWVRLNVVSASAFIVKDYAYNTIPNQPILAGEVSCAIPTVSLTQSGSLSFCNGDSVTLTAHGSGYQYQWKKNGVNITGATSKSYVAKTAGIYKCRVTNSCGSKSSGTRTVTVPCRMSNEIIDEALEQISVYPNPATNILTIKLPSEDAGEIQIVNLFGQMVYSEKVMAITSGTAQTLVDVSSFAAGMYVVRWSSGQNYETKTISVTK